ncbi:hypothetical protein BJ944DRAFT_57297 [Cunninghamella echinulata]|nr:hypothetical protein BJ944DRAFT_57297 [Cunninghamella echinulata]
MMEIDDLVLAVKGRIIISAMKVIEESQNVIVVAEEMKNWLVAVAIVAGINLHKNHQHLPQDVVDNLDQGHLQDHILLLEDHLHHHLILDRTLSSVLREDIHLHQKNYINQHLFLHLPKKKFHHHHLIIILIMEYQKVIHYHLHQHNQRQEVLPHQL